MNGEIATDRINLAHAAPTRLGSLTIEPALRRVTHEDGRELFLEPRVMQVLVALLQAQGRILSRDDLSARCWDGRIVGDDAINRVLSRLRRLAEDIGDGSFEIETITKVGYRLRQTGEADPFPFMPMDETPVGRRPHRWWMIAALILIAIGSILLVRHFRGHDGPPQVRIGAFGTLSPGLPPAFGNSIREEVIASFGTDSVLSLLDGPQSAAAGRHVYVLSGSIRRADDQMRFVAHLNDEGSGADLWSNAIDIPAADAAVAPRRIAATVSQIVRCALSGAAEHPRILPDHTMSLYAAYCAEWWSETSNIDRVIDAARAVTQAAPDFSRAWSGLAANEAIAMRDRSRPDWQEINTEAQQATARAIDLDPYNSEAYEAKAMLLPLHDYRGKQALHEKSVTLRPTDCGCEHQYYALFLAGVGRTTDAIFEAKRGHDMEPQALVSTMRWAEYLLVGGRADDAAPLIAQSQILWPNAAYLARLRLYAALWTGRYTDGLRPGPAALPAGAQPLFEALASGNAAVKAKAAETLWTLAGDPATNSRLIVNGLAALGRDDRALAAAQSLIDRQGGYALPVLFDPPLKRLRTTPAFAATVGRLGLADYWRSSHRPPDFCQGIDTPPFCATIR